MAMLVHITTEQAARMMLKSGIRAERCVINGVAGKGVYAMPVTRNFMVSHQWLRELKRGRSGSLVGLYIRVPDDELVHWGRYNQVHVSITAAEAVGRAMHGDTMDGSQIVLRRKILASEIHRVRRLPQLVGWRHYPEAHGKRPWACACCQRGEYGSAKIRMRLGESPRGRFAG